MFVIVSLIERGNSPFEEIAPQVEGPFETEIEARDHLIASGPRPHDQFVCAVRAHRATKTS